MKEYTVKEVADHFNKHEETIKRWIRLGQLPNSYRNSDKEGWRIIESDLLNLNSVKTRNQTKQVKDLEEESELVKIAYQAVTLTSPTDEIITILTVVGIKRTLELLLIMQQSATKVKNPDGFIRKAIRENWNPTPPPIKLLKQQSKRIYDLSQEDFDTEDFRLKNQQSLNLPRYNWLEEK